MSDEGVTITGAGIPLYQWLAIRGALTLELRVRHTGMRSRRLSQAWPHIRLQLGMKPRRMTEKALMETLAVVETKIEDLKKNLKPGDIEVF